VRISGGANMDEGEGVRLQGEKGIERIVGRIRMGRRRERERRKGDGR